MFEILRRGSKKRPQPWNGYFPGKMAATRCTSQDRVVKEKSNIGEGHSPLCDLSVSQAVSNEADAVTYPLIQSLPSDTDSMPVTAIAKRESEMTNHREYVSTQSTGLKTDSWCANSTTDSIACEIIPRHF